MCNSYIILELFVVFKSVLSVVLSSDFKPLGIDWKDSEEVPNILRALKCNNL